MDGKAAASRARSQPQGSFQDFDLLLEQLGSEPLIELGKPLPNEKYLPKARAGTCPVAHNRALIGEDLA